jgi:hypothetical protein
MTDIATLNSPIEIFNTPLSIELGGRKLLYKRLPLAILKGELKAIAKSKYIADMEQVCSSIKDKKERQEFRSEYTANLRSSKTLKDDNGNEYNVKFIDELTDAEIRSEEGQYYIMYLILLQCPENKIKLEDIAEFAKQQDFWDKLYVINQYGLGLDNIDNNVKNTEESEKK